jgi:homoaconitate hydratase
MGSPDALAYLASPAVVAASAISGYIDFDWDEEKSIKGEIVENKNAQTSNAKVEIIDGFPTKLNGELIFCNRDNINTDGIYPGKYTYIDDFTPEDQAKVVMENYDPQFKEIVKEGDILVSGFNFGTGSSREQAATALKYRGVKAVITGSFSATYMRNAINNGFLTITSPELVKALRDKFDGDDLTIRAGISAEIDFENSIINVEGVEYPISPVGKIAQELILTEGLENWVKKQL